MNRHIEIDPRVCNGRPVLAGTRIPVAVILDHLADGRSVDQIRELYPEISADQITAAIRFCHSVLEHTELELVGA
jgi:uncharacterized protein (DUF433 family)